MKWLREMFHLYRQYRQAVRDEKAAMQAWQEEMDSWRREKRARRDTLSEHPE